MSLAYPMNKLVNGITAAQETPTRKSSGAADEFSSLMENFVRGTADSRGSAPEALELLALFGEIGRMEETNG